MQSRILAVFILGCAGRFSVFGSSITVGVNTGSNTFPFGSAYSSNPGTRYQEAYASSLFSSPMSITGVDFFLASPGTLYGGTYTLSFSTVATDVNSLSDTNFNSNLGSNNTVFDVVTITTGTSAPNELTFIGAPFNYNPANGNLLLDIQVVNPSAGTSTFEDGDGAGPSTIARYHNFGSGTSGFGLVTEFDFSTTAVPEPGTLTLLSLGLAGFAGWRARRS